MRMPDFLIVGAQKAGTTTLHHYLSLHPDIHFPEKKEIHFFDKKNINSDNVFKYSKNFSQAKSSQFCGEATPIYMYYPEALHNIHREIGDLKIIIIVRQPVFRAYSHYWHEIKNGYEYKSFVDSIYRKPKNSDYYIRHHSYIERSCYSSQIENAKKLFGKDNVKVIKMENMMNEPLKYVNCVLRFISPSLTSIQELHPEVKNSSMIPINKKVHSIISCLNSTLGGVPGVRKILRINLKNEKYPRISDYEYKIAKEMILARDPNVRDFYPDL